MAEVVSLLISMKKKDSIYGLTEGQVEKLLRDWGFNEMPSPEHRSILTIAGNIIKEPMFLLLVACGSIYLVLGNRLEAQMLLAFVFVIMAITFFQERKTERALESLRNLSSPRALVIREGKEKRISGREVVPGDIVVLAEGDRVPADGEIVSASNLYVDESLITGESEPVRKNPLNHVKNSSMDERLCFVYAGALVVSGYGIMKVVSTGSRTVVGSIGKSIQNIESAETLVQKEVRLLVKRFSIAGFFLCMVVVFSHWLLNFGWLNGILAGLTLAMAILPEEFPVILTIFFALGAWRIARHNVLTRRMPVIETLGAATVLCVDKTGTLTTNQMEIRGLYADGEILIIDDDGIDRIPETFHRVVEFGVLAGLEKPFDPMESALQIFAKKHLAETEHIHNNWTLVHEYPFSENLPSMANVWKSPDGRDYIIAVKGAPETIADLCHFDSKTRMELEKTVKRMANEGLRILGVASASFRQDSVLPGEQHDFNFAFLGLIGLMDPPRLSVSSAIELCRKAGIKVVMITGDYPDTALNIARKIGLDISGRIITGQQLEQMDEDTLSQAVKDVSIFARVVPEQKLRIVNAYKKSGEIVAMTGDGVNDAPALKSAHIGIAMGEKGTDVAREASDIVLLDDDFSSIVESIKTGRRIFDNLKKAMSYIISIHVPVAGMSLFPVMMGFPLVLGPVHIVFLEMIIDPACSTVFEAEAAEPGLMDRPPRKIGESVLDRKTFLLCFLQGLVVFGVVFAVFLFALASGHDEKRSKAITYITLIVANICLIFTNRSRTRFAFSMGSSINKSLVFVVATTLIFLILVNTNPFLRNLFRFGPLDFNDFLVCFTAGIASILWFEGLKFFRRKKDKYHCRS